MSELWLWGHPQRKYMNYIICNAQRTQELVIAGAQLDNMSIYQWCILTGQFWYFTHDLSAEEGLIRSISEGDMSVPHQGWQFRVLTCSTARWILDLFHNSYIIWILVAIPPAYFHFKYVDLRMKVVLSTTRLIHILSGYMDWTMMVMEMNWTMKG